MNATPAICPACGELVVALFLGDDQNATVPDHPDRAFPWMICAASDRADLGLTIQRTNPE